MSLSKIPDELLKKFQCFQCTRYLSVAPIGVRADGQSICGRCTNWAGPQSMAVTRCKLFEELAVLHLFPCSFRPQGCPEYIQFDKMLNHENQCLYRTYRCPASYHSTCNWVGALSQICSHYKQQHPGLYLKEPRFRLSLQGHYENYKVVKVNRVPFLLQIKYEEEKKKIWFNAVCIVDGEAEAAVTYKVKLSGLVPGRVMVTESKRPSPVTQMHMIPAQSLEVDVDGLLALLKHPGTVQCQWLFIDGSRLHLEIYDQEWANSAKCPNCTLAIIPPIYRCPFGHITCLDCMGYKDTCGICHQSGLEFTRAIDLEDVSYSAQFHCKWNNCSEVLDCSKIRDHQQVCPERIYTCPKCTECIGLIDSVDQHFRLNHAETRFIVEESGTVLLNAETVFMYMLVHKEWFKVNVFKKEKFMSNVHITFCGPRSMNTYFRYEVQDCWNVLYYASKCPTNHYMASSQRTYCINDLRSRYSLTIKFNKHANCDVWMPIDCPSKKTRWN